MAPIEHARQSEEAPARGPRPAAGEVGGSGLFTLLWLIFLVILVVEPSRLDATWWWLRDLPIVAQVVGWIVFLPLVIGLAIWQAPWAPWVRVTLIVLLAIANIATFAPRR
ncbi:MAG TPA: hypothetical protein VK875_10625 [Euzebyales bacterium]|nr:hypothetical protein [Euzebyales bacterium]